MKKPAYTYRAVVTSVYDGDSIKADFDMGMFLWMRNRAIRINGIDTPERRGPQKEAGKVVGNWLRQLIDGQEIIVSTRKPDKYGRVLADVFLNGKSIADLLIAKGYAKAYDGGTKSKWTDRQIKKIASS